MWRALQLQTAFRLPAALRMLRALRVWQSPSIPLAVILLIYDTGLSAGTWRLVATAVACLVCEDRISNLRIATSTPEATTTASMALFLGLLMCGDVMEGAWGHGQHGWHLCSHTRHS